MSAADLRAEGDGGRSRTDAEYERLFRAERAARAEAERERTEAEWQRNAAERARADAEAANRAKGDFLATMSHELRTPINAILGYAELLDLGIFGAVTPAQHEHLERLRASARHLLGLVSDVLDLAKVDAGRLEVRREVAATGSAVAAATALVQPQATAKGVALIDLHAGEPGVRYVGDEHRTQQIVINLLSNAVKFTPPGGRITIECGESTRADPGEVGRAGHASPAAGPGPWAYVRVDDTGPGIPSEFLARLFEPFVQAHGSYTREHGGTGLGLSISRRLARLMGGDLTARNKPGDGGAVFTLWLPTPGADEGGTTDETSESAGARASAAGSAGSVGDPPLTAGRPVEPAAPLDADAYAVVHALGLRLTSLSETTAERYLARLRTDDLDGGVPGRGELAAVQLLDHAAPFVGLIASQLATLGELRGRAPQLLRDAGRIQRFMAELHGAQRRRLGWAEPHLERDYAILAEEIEHTLRAAVDDGATAGVAPADPADGDAPDARRDRRTRDAARDYAIQVALHVLERARRTSVAAFRTAAHATGW